jgi:mycoredoxin
MKKVIILAFICGSIWLWSDRNTLANQNVINDIQVSELPSDSVILFATEWCPVCKKARKYFESHGIDYLEYDVEKSDAGMQEYKKISNSRGVPLVYYNGAYVLGFNENKIQRLLQDKQSAAQ